MVAEETQQQSEVVKIVQEAKESVQKEIKEAGEDSGKKDQLAKRIIDELKTGKTIAQEATESITHGRGQQVGKENEVLRILTRAIEAAKEGILPPEISDQAKEVLKSLGDQNIGPSTATAIESVLSDYLLGQKPMFDITGKPTDDFKRAFATLNAISPTAADQVRNTLNYLASSGRISGLTSAQVNEAFPVTDIYSRLEEQQRRAEEMQKLQSKQFEEEAKLRHPTIEIEREYKKLRLKINEAITRAYEKNMTLNQSDPNYFTSADDSKVKNFLGFYKEEGYEQSLAKLGIPQEEIKRFIELTDQLFGHVDIRTAKSFAGGYRTILEEAEQEFDVRKFIEKGWIAKEEYEEEKDGVKVKKVRLGFSREKRQEFRELITKYYFKVLQEIHGDKSHSFQQKFSEEMTYGYFFGGLRSIIANACHDLANNHFEDNDEVQKFLDDMSSRYLGSILALGQTLHDLPLLARNLANFEKFPEFLQYLFPSQLAELFDDKEGFMQIARDEIAALIREKLVLNGNKYPASLKSGNYKEEGVRWSLNFEEEIRDILIARAKELGLDLEREDRWKLDRAITYASGLGIATLMDPELESTSDPVGNFEELDPMITAVALKHNWRAGRGDPYAGLIAKFLLRQKLEPFTEARGFWSRLWKQKRFVPKEIADEINRLMVVYGDKVMESLFNFDRFGSYQELLSMVNFAASLISRGGWRFRSLRQELYSNFKLEYGLAEFDGDDLWRENWRAEDWRRLFDLSMREYGNASLWVFLSSGPTRLDTEMKTLLASKLGLDVTDEEFKKYSGREALKKIIEFTDFDGKVKKMNFFDIRTIRSAQMRGEIFFRQLRRNPGDFFMLLSQLAPEVATADKAGYQADVFLSDQELHDKYRVGKIKKTERELEIVKARRNELIRRFGPEQFETLKKINKWVIESAKTVINPKTGKPFGADDIAGFVSYLRRSSTTAYEQMMKANEPYKRQIEEIRRDKIKTEAQKKMEIEAVRKKMRMYVVEQDFGGKKELIEAIFGSDGLIKISTGMRADQLDDFYENFGDYDKAGKDTIFYRMGHGWTMRQGDINPFATDFNHYAIYKHLGAVGESVQTRWLGDAAAGYKEIMQKIPNLETVLLHAARDGNFGEIEKLHEALFNTLKNTIGDEYAHRANFILASIVTQFFWEHSLTRDPKLKWLLPASIATRLMIGSKLSLSKILTDNRHAYSMDTNAARTYFMNLSLKQYIPKEGMWSFEQLNLAFDAKEDTFIFGDVVPSFIWVVMLFLMWTYVKKAVEESEGKKPN